MAKYYDAKILEMMILKRYPNIRESADYSELEDRLFDYTNACNIDEQRAWMDHYMSQAIHQDAYAVKVLSLRRENANTVEQMRYEAALQFIVAYDMKA